MSQELSFEEWKRQLFEKLRAAGYDPEGDDPIDPEILEMAYSMEELSVEQAFRDNMVGRKPRS